MRRDQTKIGIDINPSLINTGYNNALNAIKGSLNEEENMPIPQGEVYLVLAASGMIGGLIAPHAIRNIAEARQLVTEAHVIENREHYVPPAEVQNLEQTRLEILKREKSDKIWGYTEAAVGEITLIPLELASALVLYAGATAAGGAIRRKLSGESKDPIDTGLKLFGADLFAYIRTEIYLRDAEEKGIITIPEDKSDEFFKNLRKKLSQTWEASVASAEQLGSASREVRLGMMRDAKNVLPQTARTFVEAEIAAGNLVVASGKNNEFFTGMTSALETSRGRGGKG